MRVSTLAFVQESLLHSVSVLLPALNEQDACKVGLALQSKTWHGSEHTRASGDRKLPVTRPVCWPSKHDLSAWVWVLSSRVSCSDQQPVRRGQLLHQCLCVLQKSSTGGAHDSCLLRMCLVSCRRKAYHMPLHSLSVGIHVL